MVNYPHDTMKVIIVCLGNLKRIHLLDDYHLCHRRGNNTMVVVVTTMASNSKGVQRRGRNVAQVSTVKALLSISRTVRTNRRMVTTRTMIVLPLQRKSTRERTEKEVHRRVPVRRTQNYATAVNYVDNRKRIMSVRINPPW